MFFEYTGPKKPPVRSLWPGIFNNLWTIGNYNDVGYTVFRVLQKYVMLGISCFFTKREPRAIVSMRIASTDCELIQRTRERKNTGDSHIDWWLY